ncbi:DUF4326 domain-containing protein [Pseudomonas sp. SLFW]|uniref:DUF4326 domain-containing protein n=1 Tax=Pseudomonas sp. SLFW TaxID=2683259 RepID=UPI001411B410|nr:DUF4326 domain-containing protein [Pseudomonas sp. SLFW]NBB11243.1 DUF4326 domain-containing protein [Pseudomonas sp. SLFW]
MKTAFVIYPPEFLCYSKFERKLGRILQSREFRVVYSEDSNGYIAKFCDSHDIVAQLYEKPEEAIKASTHAVFFEDRESYFEIKQQVFDLGIPYRTIVLDLTIVVNKDRGDKYEVYVGRGTIWGNPYQMGVDGDRDEVIRKFRYDFEHGLLKASSDLERNLDIVRGKVIACHCKPAACHGDVIASYLNALDDGK